MKCRKYSAQSRNRKTQYVKSLVRTHRRKGSRVRAYLRSRPKSPRRSGGKTVFRKSHDRRRNKTCNVGNTTCKRDVRIRSRVNLIIPIRILRSPNFSPDGKKYIPSIIPPTVAPNIIPKNTPVVSPKNTPKVVPNVVPKNTPTVSPKNTPKVVPNVVPKNTPTVSPSIKPEMPNPYGSPYGNSYGSPYGNSYGSSYGNSYGSSYGSPYGNSYGSPYGNSYGSPYGVNSMSNFTDNITSNANLLTSDEYKKLGSKLLQFTKRTGINFEKYNIKDIRCFINKWLWKCYTTDGPILQNNSCRKDNCCYTSIDTLYKCFTPLIRFMSNMDHLVINYPYQTPYYYLVIAPPFMGKTQLSKNLGLFDIDANYSLFQDGADNPLSYPYRVPYTFQEYISYIYDYDQYTDIIEDYNRNMIDFLIYLITANVHNTNKYVTNLFIDEYTINTLAEHNIILCCYALNESELKRNYTARKGLLISTNNLGVKIEVPMEYSYLLHYVRDMLRDFIFYCLPIFSDMNKLGAFLDTPQTKLNNFTLTQYNQYKNTIAYMYHNIGHCMCITMRNDGFSPQLLHNPNIDSSDSCRALLHLLGNIVYYRNILLLFMDNLYQNTSTPTNTLLINLGDFPVAPKAQVYAYQSIRPVPRTYRHDLQPQSPIYSFTGNVDYMDKLIPTPDTIKYIYNMGDYSKQTIEYFYTNWSKKINKAVFRGGSTGCLLGLENQRILSHLLSLAFPDYLNSRIIDNTVYNRYITPYVSTVVNPVRVYYEIPELYEGFSYNNNYMMVKEQSQYKYMLNMDGFTAAWRLLFLFMTQSLVLKQDSQWIEYYYPLLVPWVHYIPIKKDLSNLIQTIIWCQKNDTICKNIAQTGYKFIMNYMTKTHVETYTRDLFVHGNHIDVVTYYRNKFNYFLPKPTLDINKIEKEINSIQLPIPVQTFDKSSLKMYYKTVTPIDKNGLYYEEESPIKNYIHIIGKTPSVYDSIFKKSPVMSQNTSLSTQRSPFNTELQKLMDIFIQLEESLSSNIDKIIMANMLGEKLKNNSNWISMTENNKAIVVNKLLIQLSKTSLTNNDKLDIIINTVKEILNSVPVKPIVRSPSMSNINKITVYQDSYGSKNRSPSINNKPQNNSIRNNTYNLSIKDVGGDGDCLYLAIADQLHKLFPNSTDTATQVRQNITDQIKSVYEKEPNKLVFLISLMDDEDIKACNEAHLNCPDTILDQEHILDLIIAYHKTPKMWGNAGILYVLSKVYGIPVIVYGGGNKTYNTQDTFTVTGATILYTFSEGNLPPIQIYYDEKMAHYMSVIQISK